jgi:hypothetical protein
MRKGQVKTPTEANERGTLTDLRAQMEGKIRERGGKKVREGHALSGERIVE